MLHSLPISLDAPAAAMMAAFFCGGACVIALARRILLPRASVMLAVAGLVCLCLAAGRVQFQAPTSPRVAVMIDISSSTRTATYHDAEALTRRIEQLLGQTPYTVFAFADQAIAVDIAQVPSEVSSRRTNFEVPAADAIVLFSDARFELPTAAPPIFVVVDPALDQVDDGAITRLDAQPGTLSIVTRSDSNAREVVVTGAAPTTLSAPPGETVLRAAVAPDASTASARVVDADPWPENNSMTIEIPPPPTAQRWWITSDPSTAPSHGWRVMSPAQFPAEGTNYLGVSVLALDNIHADQLTRLQHERIEQFVRDLGGGLMILGGDQSFAAGGYSGTVLERLSPLSCNPPDPATNWALLIDSSGSMAASIGDNSRWNFATNAMVNLIPLLPPRDTISIGDFAKDVRWWASGKTVEEVELHELVPKDVSPTGPTNLEPALRQLAQSASAASPTQAILITDGEASITGAAGLATELSHKRVRVSVLSHQPLAAGSALYEIVRHTGGKDLAQSDPREWGVAARSLLRDATPPWLNTSTLAVEFSPDAGDFSPLSASPWNRTWLKPNATELASARDEQGNRVPAIAAWNMRSGAVLSAAFRPPNDVADALAQIVATPPRDPRFNVRWDTANQLSVTLDAVDTHGGSRYLNALTPQLVVTSEQRSLTFTQPLTQTAPGRYAITLPPPRRAVLATLMLEGKPIDRVAIAERYPPEFNAVGNDRGAMRRLAQLSGGEVIEPSRTEPIDLPRRPRDATPISSPLAAVGAGLIAAAIARWKLG